MLQLLRACSGAFQPGVLTALVGSSGAGKTTLMDVIAGRKTSAPSHALFQGLLVGFGAAAPPALAGLPSWRALSSAPLVPVDLCLAVCMPGMCTS